MLVLTRKPKQTIRIGNDITLSVVRIRGNTVQLGIVAPREVSILRSELTEQPAKEDSADCEVKAKEEAKDEDDTEGCIINLEISKIQEDFESPLQQFMFAP